MVISYLTFETAFETIKKLQLWQTKRKTETAQGKDSRRPAGRIQTCPNDRRDRFGLSPHPGHVQGSVGLHYKRLEQKKSDSLPCFNTKTLMLIGYARVSTLD